MSWIFPWGLESGWTYPKKLTQEVAGGILLEPPQGASYWPPQGASYWYGGVVWQPLERQSLSGRGSSLEDTLLLFVSTMSFFSHYPELKPWVGVWMENEPANLHRWFLTQLFQTNASTLLQTLHQSISQSPAPYFSPWQMSPRGIWPSNIYITEGKQLTLVHCTTFCCVQVLHRQSVEQQLL